ncbi:MAG TPA: hypothetical protein VF855_10150, partial [Acidimicrobiales bacterium]
MPRSTRAVPRHVAVAALMAGLLLASCGDDGASSAATTTAAPQTTGPATTPAPTTSVAPTTTAAATKIGPEGDAFYTAPDPLPGTKPGDISWVSPIGEVPSGLKAWKILYRSETVSGKPTAVSGLLSAPEKAAGPLDIIAVAHGTTSLGDQCAPS